MDRSTPGFPVLHQLPELAQTHGLSSWWCDPIISSSVIPFSACLQSFPASWSFPVSQFLAFGGQRIRASASTSVLPMNIQGWLPLGLTGLISLLSKRLSSLLQHHNLKASVPQHSAFFMVQLSHPFMTTGKPIALTRWIFVGKVMSLFFNMLYRFVIAFLPRSKHLSSLGDFRLFCYKPQSWVDGLLGSVSLPVNYPPSGWLWSWTFKWQQESWAVLGVGRISALWFCQLWLIFCIIYHPKRYILLSSHWQNNSKLAVISMLESWTWKSNKI